MKRSPFFFVGDKYKLMSQLSDFFPSNINTFIEPFVGGGSVFLNTNAKNYAVNDLNPFLIKLHRFLFDHKENTSFFFDECKKIILHYGFSASLLGFFVPTDLKKQYAKTYYARYNKAPYEKLKKDFNKDNSDLLKLYILLVYGFNHMLRFNSKGEFNLPVGNVDFNKNVLRALNDYFQFSQKSMISYFNLDFESFLLSREYKKDDFVYVDPPYLISSSEYNKNWTTQEEERLLRVLDKLSENKVKFALSNVLIHKGRTNFTLLKWSSKYLIDPINSNYISFHNNSKKDTKEVLIKNYK
jgi:DNA adenine methylase